jgi:mRNA interferase RelE/StbE
VNYSIEILPRADKELDSLPGQIRERISSAIEELGETPRPPGCKKLRDRDGWRIRIGRYRVLYVVDDERRRVVIVHVGHRKEVYR